MQHWHVRPFRPGDLDEILDVWERGAPVDATTQSALVENVLLDVNFHPGGLLVAEQAGQVAGAVYAVATGSPAVPTPPGGGWITFLVVDPDRRRQGIGRALLDAALVALADRGAQWVDLLGYAPAYFLPGVDEHHYPAAVALLRSAGFAAGSEFVAMDRSLATYSTPEAATTLIRDRVAEGYRFGPATPGDLPEAIAFASGRLAPDWGQVLRDAVIRFGKPARVILARDPADHVVGFATYGTYLGLRERFGPFGVDESQRGRKLGEILLHLTLSRMRAEGAHSAWFLWTEEDSPAGHLYRKAGFAVTRRFRGWRRALG